MQFLYVDVLNYCYFYTDHSTFLKVKNVLENVNKNLFFI